MSFLTKYYTAADAKEMTPTDWNTEMDRVYGQLKEAWESTIIAGFSGTGTVGLVYYIDNDGALQLAGRDISDQNQFVVGMSNGQEGEIFVRGIITGSFSRGALYYLGFNGTLSTSAPSIGSGLWYFPIGKAISTTQLFVDIRQDAFNRR